MSSGNSNPAHFDRQLKKIYDCLNIGSNKKAVQEVDRLPKDAKDNTVFKSLKALALIRLNKRRQAFDILDEIDLKKDLDVLTMQTMTSCYKESVEVARIVDLYEAAASKKSNDPEIMSHLFMAYVRVFNFKRQKEVALQMYKTFSQKKRLYSFWAIMSLVMQSHEVKGNDQDAIDKRVCLSLAEKMCEKMIDEERTHEEIELYLMILRKQQKHQEEYRFLTGQYCLRITDHLSWFNRRRAYLCLDLKMCSRAFKHYFPTLIQEYPDQIEYYQGLFKSAFLLDTEAPSQQQPVAISDQQSAGGAQPTGTPVKTTSALAECYDIVEKQCYFAMESGDSAKDQAKNRNQSAPKNLSRTPSLNPNRKRVLRGPFIARIELYHTVLSNKGTLPDNVYNQCLNQFSAKYPNLVALLLDFFQAFCKKIICYYDMDYMINRFKPTQEQTAELIRSIGRWVEQLRANHPEMTPNDMYHSILNYHMLEHSLRKYNTGDNREDRLRLAKKYIDLYDDNRELGKSFIRTEFLPIDHYCLLAVNSLMTNAIGLNQSITPQSILTDQTLISLIVLAENGIANSPSNHQIKLLLLKLYSFIGASKQCSNVLLTLDIKHFQIDTLGHLLNPVLYNTGNYTLSRESLETCLEFYSHGVRECFEGLTTSYKDGRFSKIEEISDVLKRLSGSLNATQCVLLGGIVQSLNAMTMDELSIASQSFDPFRGLHRMFRDPKPTDAIRDSRDLKVLRSLHFEVNELVQERKQQTLDDETLWLKLRYHLTRCSYMQFNHFVTKNNPSKKGHQSPTEVEEIKLGLAEVESLLPKINERLTATKDDRYSYLEPEASPFRWTHIKFDKLINLVKPVVFCVDPSNLSISDGEDYATNLVEIVNHIESQLSATDSLVVMKQTLLTLSISLEFLSLCVTSLVSLANESISPSNGTPAVSKSAPDSQSTTCTKSRAIIARMISQTDCHLSRISGFIKTVDLKSSPILNKITSVDELLLSNPSKNADTLVTKSGVTVNPLMRKESCQIMLTKVKEKILDSYSESLKEIDATCQRKLKLLRAKVCTLIKCM